MKNRPEAQKAWNARNRASRLLSYKRHNLKRNYGLTLERYEQIFAAQNQVCAICQRTESSGRGWHVDHDHQTGRVRGILCHYCNTALGAFGDQPAMLQKAISYLNGE